MKIRTDFVTNSSSSSFVVAQIETGAAELSEAVKVACGNAVCSSGGYCVVDGKNILMRDSSDDFGFYFTRPSSPCKVIEALAEFMDACDYHEQSNEILAKKEELADSIEFYEITVGAESWGSEYDDDFLTGEDYGRKIACTLATYSYEKGKGNTMIQDYSTPDFRGIDWYMDHILRSWEHENAKDS